MDKKGIIAISLAIAVMVIWQIKFAPKYVPPPPKPAPAAMATPVERASSPAAETAEAPAPAPSTQAAPTVTETIETVKTPSVEYSFTNLGGGIARADLLKHKAEEGADVVLNHADSTPIGAISETPGEEMTVPSTVSVRSETEVVCERETPQQILISKRFTLPKDSEGIGEYLVKLDTTFSNRAAQPARMGNWYISIGSAAAIHKKDLPTYLSFNWFAQGKMSSRNVTWFSEGRFPILGFQTSPEKAFYSEQREKISWAGVRNQYFTSIITSPDADGNGVWTRRFPIGSEPNGQHFAIEGALEMPGMTLAVGEAKTSHFELWIGPKEYDRLKRLGHQEDEIMQFGMFKWVSEFLLTSMNWLHSIFENFGGYAVAIIILTLCIRSRDVAVDQQIDAIDEEDAGRSTEDERAEGKVQGRPDADEPGTDEALQRVRHQSVRRLSADGFPDPDLLRILRDARHGDRAAEQPFSLGQGPFAARHDLPPRRDFRSTSCRFSWRPRCSGRCRSRRKRATRCSSGSSCLCR